MNWREFHHPSRRRRRVAACGRLQALTCILMAIGSRGSSIKRAITHPMRQRARPQRGQLCRVQAFPLHLHVAAGANP